MLLLGEKRLPKLVASNDHSIHALKFCGSGFRQGPTGAASLCSTAWEPPGKVCQGLGSTWECPLRAAWRWMLALGWDSPAGATSRCLRFLKSWQPQAVGLFWGAARGCRGQCPSAQGGSWGSLFPPRLRSRVGSLLLFQVIISMPQTSPTPTPRN